MKKRLENNELIDASKVYSLIQETLNNMSYKDLENAFNHICPERIELNQDGHSYKVINNTTNRDFTVKIESERKEPFMGQVHYFLKVIFEDGSEFEGMAFKSTGQDISHIELFDDFKELVLANKLSETEVKSKIIKLL